ncbi:MAG: tyrosine-type recombinase/integrase [Syntrophobacteraceae bacterium]
MVSRYRCSVFKHSADFVRIAMLTGIRKSEIMKLKWRDLDLDRKMITLRNPKGSVTETIPISNEAAVFFRGIETTSEYVIPGPDGKMKKTFRDPWYKIRKAAGLPEHYIVLTNTLTKNTVKVPPADIKEAKKCLADFLARVDEKTLREIVKRERSKPTLENSLDESRFIDRQCQFRPGAL